MSGSLQIHFAPDMPGAVVEVVAPNLETVNRVWMDPGTSHTVDVPSEASFLRVHFPSGRVVTLHDPGKLSREIRLADLTDRTARGSPADSVLSTESKPKIRDVRAVRSDGLQSSMPSSPEGSDILKATDPVPGKVRLADSLTDGMKVELEVPGRLVLPSGRMQKGQTTFSDLSEPDACWLNVSVPTGDVRVHLPGLLKEVLVRTDTANDGKPAVNIRVATNSEAADSLMTYLTRGDLYSAASLTSWAAKAEHLLFEKHRDPFAAIAGAYLLLKLRRFDLMRTWVRNLSQYFSHLSDGKIIWAWQLIHRRDPNAEAEIRTLLTTVAAAELPIFTEGLNLLRDGLNLLGSSSKNHLERLNKEVGIVLNDSPFTAGLHSRNRNDSRRIQFSVGYLSPA